MTAELTAYEAEILIAVLTFAEGVALMENPSMVEALKQLRPWRSALLQSYLRDRLGTAKPSDAVDPVADSHPSVPRASEDSALLSGGGLPPPRGAQPDTP